MKGIAQLERRVKVLEKRVGIVVLSDGSIINPSSVIDLFVALMGVENTLQEENREATLQDFPPEIWGELRKWPLWDLQPTKDGAIIDYVVRGARSLMSAG